jgi:hypothetical protein
MGAASPVSRIVIEEAPPGGDHFVRRGRPMDQRPERCRGLDVHKATEGEPYHNLGPDYYHRRHTERVTRHAVQTLERQSYRVTLEPPA